MADTAVTIARARTSQLSLQEQARGFSHKFTVKSSDVALGSGSTDTVTVTLGALPAKYVMNNALVNITTAFAGPPSRRASWTSTSTSSICPIRRSSDNRDPTGGIPKGLCPLPLLW